MHERRTASTFARAGGAAASPGSPPSLSTEGGPGPTTLVARLADLSRSSSFLWLETTLQMQERLVRAASANLPPWPASTLSRGLAVAALAADLYLGYASLRHRQRYWPGLVGPEDWQVEHNRGAARSLATASSLGATLIKAGQLASVRGDLLPAAYVQALAVLQDRVPPHPWPVIERALVAELDRPLDDVFTRVETAPVAAASLAHVHRAWLRGDDRPVALKVQYPEIQSLVTADLLVLRGLVATIELLEPGLRLDPILEHLEDTLPLELDFRREAAAMVTLRRALAHRADVVIPDVVPELCTRRLVVMDFVDGVKITDAAALEQAGSDPRRVARLLNQVYAEQLLKLGWLHADPHPGNLRVQPGPRLVLLDHGLTVELRPALVGALQAMVGALARGDMPALLQAMRRVGCPVRAGTEIGSLLQLAGVLLGSEDPADVGRRLGAAIGDVPSELITVGRALSLLSGVTRALDPQLNVLELVAASA